MQRKALQATDQSSTSPEFAGFQAFIDSAGAGSILPGHVRDAIEPVLNADLSKVRVHDNQFAHQAAKQIKAKAFTRGHHIYLGAGKSSSDMRLMAHEATHTVQQQNRFAPAVQKDPDDEYEPPPPSQDVLDYSDESVREWLRQRRLPVLMIVDMMGGLRGMETTHPLSYRTARAILERRYSTNVVLGIYDNEPRIRSLAYRSELITARLSEIMDDYTQNEQWAAIEYMSSAYRNYDFSYGNIVEIYAENGIGGLAILEAVIGGDPYEITAALESEADAAQAEQIRIEAQRAEYIEIGENEVGTVVGTQEILFWWDDTVILESLIEPTCGTETYDEALTWARISGQATAVRQLQGRYYLFRLNHQYDYEDLQYLEGSHLTDLLHNSAGRGMTVVTTDGVVLNAQRGNRFSSGSQYQTGAENYASAAGIVHDPEQSLSFDQEFALFQDMVRSLAFQNLEDARDRLTEQLDQFFEIPGYHYPINLDPTAGEALQHDTAHLRRLMIRASEMCDRIGDEPSEEERDELTQLLAEIGELHEQNPLAALFIEDNTTPPDAPQYLVLPGMVGVITPESLGMGPEDLIEDQLADMRSGDAAYAAAQEISRRLRNVEKVRQYILENPDAALKLTVLHGQVLNHFESISQDYIRVRIILDGMVQIARSIGLAVAEIAVAVVGTFIGGPVGFALTGGTTLYGVSQTIEAFEDLETLEAMSELDLEGRIMFASREQVESARFWAYVGLGLTMLDVAGFASSARSMTKMRSVLSAPELAASNRQTQRNLTAVAELMGETEDTLVSRLSTAHGAERRQLQQQIDQSMELVTARSGDLAGGGVYWIDNLSENARRALQENDEVAAAYRAMDDDVRRLFTRCHSPCEIALNPSPTTAQAQRINRIIESNQIRHLPDDQRVRIMAKLKNYFQENVDNLDEAIHGLPEPGTRELSAARHGNPVDPHVQPDARQGIGDRFEAMLDYRMSGSIPAHLRDPVWEELNSEIASARAMSGIQRAEGGGVVAAARHDIQALDIGDSVHGYSPNAHPEGRAGISREIEAPDYLPAQATEHAEQDTLGQIASSIRRAREAGQVVDLEGKTIWMRVEQTVCQACRLGLTNPDLPEEGWGVIRRFSEQFPELRITITVQNSNEMLEVMGGRIINHIQG